MDIYVNFLNNLFVEDAEIGIEERMRPHMNTTMYEAYPNSNNLVGDEFLME
jgi:hypothetical protein